MQATLKDLTGHRVAGGASADVRAWLTQRLHWEARLRDLEAARDIAAVPFSTSPRAGGAVRLVDARFGSVARAS